jgi:hypothetical protein
LAAEDLPVLQDLRFAARMLVRDRLVTAVAVLALGLGIGLNATVFTFVNAVLIRGLPIPQPEQVFHLNGRNTATGQPLGISHLDCLEMRAQTQGFQTLAAYRNSSHLRAAPAAPLLGRDSRVAALAARPAIGLRLCDVMGREASAQFMALSIVTVCYLV